LIAVDLLVEINLPKKTDEDSVTKRSSGSFEMKTDVFTVTVAEILRYRLLSRILIGKKKV